MKGLTRLCLKLNSSFQFSKFNRLPILRCNFERHNYEEIKIRRYQSNYKGIFSGPGLKDFIAESVNSKQELVEEDNSPIPYLDQLDLNGRGQTGWRAFWSVGGLNRAKVIVYFAVYGCQMNVSDVEVVWSILQKNGYQKATERNKADIILIMTCAIRESAEAKIWCLIKEINALKRQKKHVKLGILGCMAERLKDKIIESYNAVDLVAGPDSYKDLPRMLAVTRNNQKAVNVLLSLDETYADIMPVRLDINEVTAFISIMRGCDNMCTYCIVPFTRGRERSRPLESVLDEVRLLSERGVKQITLLGQNVNSYRDISCQDNFKEPTKLSAGFKTVYKTKTGGLRFDVLLDKVSQIDPNMRIRFTAPHPKDFPDEVLYLIRERKNICSHLHLPVQSGSTTVLERMRRGYTREAYLELVDHIRSILPNVSFFTDIIVGFCGEREEDHEDTLDLLRKVRYNFVFHFAYSMREKTTAHRRYEDDVPYEVKMRRCREVEELFRSIAHRLNEAQINQTQLVLIDGFSRKSKDFLQGRNDGNTRVLVPCCSVPSSISSSDARPVKAGDYVAVRITDANSQVLRGTPLYHTSVVDFDESEEDTKFWKQQITST